MSFVITKHCKWRFLVGSLAFAGATLGVQATPQPRVEVHLAAGAEVESLGVGQIELQVDDGSAESVFGLAGAGTRQFLWFNHFEGPRPFILEQMQVLFPAGTDVEVGDTIELVVYIDGDGDPSDGATLVLNWLEVVQANDGVTLSIYPLPEPLRLYSSDDVLLGVINRFHQTGVDPDNTQPASLDTTDSQGRSFFAVWNGDPPSLPDLASATDITLLDGLLGGNFIIRGSGSNAPVVEIPTTGRWGLLALLLLLSMVGTQKLRR